MINFIKDSYQRLISQINTKTYRYLYESFSLTNRLTGLIGPRGVGKTTLMLQYIKENLHSEKKVFYFSADHAYFNTNSLLGFINQLYTEDGIEIFFIDEIHKYKYGDWSQEIKNIYDSYPSVKIIFSGSSSLDLVHGSYDLSRRAKIYRLHGLSFREYLNFKTDSNYKSVQFEILMKKYTGYNQSWSQIPKLLGHFKEYLQLGYYPFLFEDPLSYYEKINQIINKSIFEDISQYYNLKTNYLYHLSKILNFLASIPPGQINIHNLAKNLSIDDKTTFNYLKMLMETGLVRLVYTFEGGNLLLRKPEKMFLNNTTLLAALNNFLGQPLSQGNMRELFFIQSLENAGVPVFYSHEGDFRTKEFIFEVGGKNKKKDQIKNSKNSFLVKDDILVSSLIEIPLYFFGFLY